MAQVKIENGDETVQLLPAINDDHGGVVVELKEHMNSDIFLTLLKTSMSQWTLQGKKGVWIKLPIHLVNLVETAVKEGFWYHHAEPDYLMLVNWIPKTTNTIPANASHRVGVGAVVLNDKRETSTNTEKGARCDKWETKEDVALMSAWCIAIEDKSRGKNQKRTSLWARVKELYDEAQAVNSEELSPRNDNQMKGRWKRLNENANKWIAAYREAYSQKKSGTSLKDVEKDAHAIYEAGGSRFNDAIVFNEVMCKHPKWELQIDCDTTSFHPEYEVGNEESGGNTKRLRTSEVGDYSVHSNQETPTSGGSTIHRPIGRDVAKKKGKGKVSQSSSSLNEFVTELRAMRITRDSEVEVMSKRLDLEQKREERELKKEERKTKKMYHVHLNRLLAKEHLSPEDEDMKHHLLAMLYGK